MKILYIIVIILALSDRINAKDCVKIVYDETKSNKGSACIECVTRRDYKVFHCRWNKEENKCISKVNVKSKDKNVIIKSADKCEIEGCKGSIELFLGLYKTFVEKRDIYDFILTSNDPAIPATISKLSYKFIGDETNENTISKKFKKHCVVQDIQNMINELVIREMRCSKASDVVDGIKQIGLKSADVVASVLDLFPFAEKVSKIITIVRSSIDLADTLNNLRESVNQLKFMEMVNGVVKDFSFISQRMLTNCQELEADAKGYEESDKVGISKVEDVISAYICNKLKESVKLKGLSSCPKLTFNTKLIKISEWLFGNSKKDQQTTEHQAKFCPDSLQHDVLLKYQNDFEEIYFNNNLNKNLDDLFTKMRADCQKTIDKDIVKDRVKPAEELLNNDKLIPQETPSKLKVKQKIEFDKNGKIVKKELVNK